MNNFGVKKSGLYNTRGQHHELIVNVRYLLFLILALIESDNSFYFLESISAQFLTKEFTFFVHFMRQHALPLVYLNRDMFLVKLIRGVIIIFFLGIVELWEG